MIITASHRRRFLTASIRVALASEATMGMVVCIAA
jgi:hypothetical protein